MIREHLGQGAGKGENSDLEEMWLKLKRKPAVGRHIGPPGQMLLAFGISSPSTGPGI